MSRAVRALIGLAAVLLMGWIWHGPAGRGEMFVDAVEARARAVVAQAQLPGVGVRLERHPLSRNAILSGPADDFQRHGMADEPGLSGRVAAVSGLGGVKWSDESRRGGWALPLLAETLLELLLAYALGFGIGAIFFARPKRRSFLD
ncbi:MAG: hypothetical protein QOJ94_2781 [Sphingomonadales bacterium]|jgi:hypothetical protein|nr:hypothetical protein [Sphingomonadales bacterium]